MNSVNLERIPLPRFSTYLIYTAVSLVGSVLRIAYVLSSTHSDSPFPPFSTNTSSDVSLLAVCVEDTWFFWSAINSAYCLLICFGRKLQRFFFGELRAAENARIRDNLSNFIFYKVVFVYGILNVEALHELLLWAGWFSVLGFLHLLAALAKDRFEFVMQSLDAPLLHTPLLSLLCTLLLLCNILMAVSIAVGTRYSIHLMFFMLAEVFQLSAKTIHVIVWYAVQLYSEVAKTAVNCGSYQKSASLYYVELIFSSMIDFGDLLHNIHLAFWNNLRVNMSGIIVGMHLQHLYYKLSQRYTRHLRYMKIRGLLDNTLKRLQIPDQDCVVCWEKLSEARELHCGHAFHASCLHIWLERSAHCPTCRSRLVSLDTDLPATVDVQQRSRQRMDEASVYASAQSIQSQSSFTRTTSEQFHITNQNTQSDTPQIVSGMETYDPCSSHSEYGTSDDIFSTVPDYGSISSSMSAMVSIQRLLDVPNKPHNRTANRISLNTNSAKSLLPATFVDALEAELIRYLQPKSASDESSANDPIQSDSGGLNGTSILTAHDEPDNILNSTSAERFSEKARTGGGIRNVTTSSSNCVEFPPKRVLRMAIRRLIHRVSQTVGAARLVRHQVTSMVSSSSDDEPTGLHYPGAHSSLIRPNVKGDAKQSSKIIPSKRQNCEVTQSTYSAVFHNTRGLREQSLRQRKLAIRDRARQRFLDTYHFSTD